MSVMILVLLQIIRNLQLEINALRIMMSTIPGLHPRVKEMLDDEEFEKFLKRHRDSDAFEEGLRAYCMEFAQRIRSETPDDKEVIEIAEYIEEFTNRPDSLFLEKRLKEEQRQSSDLNWLRDALSEFEKKPPPDGHG